MNIRKMMRENYGDYSFKDLEYGVKLLREEIEEINVAIKLCRKIALNPYRRMSASDKNYILSRMTKPFIDRREELEEIISKAENEISDRLLTGNDDGAVMRELLGANHV